MKVMTGVVSRVDEERQRLVLLCNAPLWLTRSWEMGMDHRARWGTLAL